MANHIFRALFLLSVQVVLVQPLVAQGRDEQCRQAYNDNRASLATPPPPELSGNVGQPCQILAIALQDVLEEKRHFGGLLDPRDLQPTRGQTASAAGTPAQGEAVPSTEPIELAGGSLAAVGSEAGAGAVTALSINPSIFFVSPRDPEATARWGRYADVTVLVPVDDADADGNGVVDYFGLRARLNLTGLRAGSAIYEEVVEAYNQVLGRAAIEIEQLIQLLEHTDTFDACVAGLLQGDMAGIEATCGGRLISPDESLYEQLRERIRRARMEADREYLGLDLRLDAGDLTPGGTDTTSGIAFFGGVAAGKRFAFSETASTGIRGRLGVYFADPDDGGSNGLARGRSRFAVDGGIGFEVLRYYHVQRLHLIGGLEFRYGTEREGDDAVTDADPYSNFLMLRGSLNVPVSASSSVSLHAGVPVAGDVGPVLSITGNWRLLWSPSF